MPPKPPKPPKLPKPRKKPSLKRSDPSTAFRIRPVNQRFFYIPASDINLSKHQVINASRFSNDNGKLICKFPHLRENSYVNLYINGAMQEGNAYTINVHTLTIKPIGGIIYAGTPIIIEAVTFCVS